MRDVMLLLFAVLGAAAVTVGCWLMDPSAGLIVAGAMTLAAVFRVGN